MSTSSIIQLLPPKVFLAQLQPTKSILCIVNTSTILSSAIQQHLSLGTAIGDPYLGYASPIKNVSTISDLYNIIQKHQPGGIAFGLPMNKSQDTTIEIEKKQQQQRDLFIQKFQQNLHLENNSLSSLVHCLIDEQLTLEDAIDRKQNEYEMWEEIDDPNDGNPSTEAAVALNAFLWKHCGGWRNTFG